MLIYTIGSTFNRTHLTILLRVKQRLDPYCRNDIPYNSSRA